MPTLFKLSIALVLTGCGVSTPFVKAADPCSKPVAIPVGWLSDSQAERLWRTDRLELLKCGDKVETLSGRAPVNVS